MFFLFSCNTRSQVKCYLSRLSNAYAYQSINLDVWCKLKCRLLSLHQHFVSCMLEFGRVLQVHFQSSIGNSFRIEGSLVASHTPKIQIYYLALYCCTSISFSASISWFRWVNNNLESTFCLVESSCSNQARVFLNVCLLYVAILARTSCCYNRYIKSDRRLLAAPKRHIQHSTTPWGNLVAISYLSSSFSSPNSVFFLLFACQIGLEV